MSHSRNPRQNIEIGTNKPTPTHHHGAEKTQLSRAREMHAKMHANARKQPSPTWETIGKHVDKQKKRHGLIWRHGRGCPGSPRTCGTCAGKATCKTAINEIIINIMSVIEEEGQM